jgi:hypothetical protein
MPDLLRNIPYDAYTELPGIRASALMHMDRSPLHYRHAVRAPSRTSDALAFGSAVHTAILEPQVFADTFTTLRFDGRTREGKAERKLARDNCLQVVTAANLTRILAIQRAVFSRPDCMDLLRDADMEVSLTWVDAEFGLPCKARLDVLGLSITDLKTTADPTPNRFMWDSGKYDYQAKMAYYREGVRQVTGKDLPVYLLAVESEAPHDVVLFQIPDDVLDVGWRKCRRLLDRVARCESEGVWPGVSPGLVQLELPPKFREAEEPQVVMKESE